MQLQRILESYEIDIVLNCIGLTNIEECEKTLMKHSELTLIFLG